ncbi:E3 ubiquitin-protein ligase rnf213-beta-like [Saccostrea cucullata]|uniref:E3 ubiquitin-protein ligase rnf213-beta-like n=1 Tax=Saccostrea cuccullata TaxID=36930 RepID=UPI002ED0CC88
MSLTTKEMSADHIGFDEEEFESDAFQRPCHYLECLERRETIIPIFQPFKMTKAQRSMEAKRAYLEILLKHCCVEDPSWYELRNFVSFLNVQLLDFENSVFCSDSMRTSFEGFSKFVLKFLIQMARDFSTQSSVLKKSESEKKNYLDHFMERKTWETRWFLKAA